MGTLNSYNFGIVEEAFCSKQDVFGIGQFNGVI